MTNNNQPVDLELSTNGSNLYIFFGGIAAGILIPPFEFYNSSKIIDESKIFIRDFAQCWYHNGLPGISTDINSTVQYLQQQIEDIQPQKVFFVGNSMGGYAAILFASLLGTGEAIAFAPQTFISPLLRLQHKDSRWKRQIRKTYGKSLLKRKIWNLKPLLQSLAGDLKVSVFISKDDRLDSIHASHIKGIPGVRVYEFDSNSGHEIVRLLRDRGDLPAIMAGTFTQ